MKTYLVQDSLYKNKVAECVPMVCTEDLYYNCSFCGNCDCKYYEEVVLVESSAA